MRLGVIGYGARISHMIKKMEALAGENVLAAIVDVRNEEIKKRLESEGYGGKVKFYTDVEDMLSDCQLDGVCIGTRCSLHARMAMKVIPHHIPLFLEKPVATTMEDLVALKRVYEENGSPKNIVVSFPLRVTPMVKLAKEIIDSGKIGTVEHVQAVNNVPYGLVYYQGWYRDEKETGGLFLQKATHDFDYINYILGIKPVRVCAVTSKQIFKGNKPAGITCDKCEDAHTCPESPRNLELFANEKRHGEGCCFAIDTGNEDSGSAIIEYETGMHVVYSQNFYSRKQAAARGARFIGYKGTLEFDWYKDELKVYMHFDSRVESYKFTAENAEHGGGDMALALNFIDVVNKKAESVSPLDAGLLSALMCIKARESARTKTFQDISWPE